MLTEKGVITAEMHSGIIDSGLGGGAVLFRCAARSILQLSSATVQLHTIGG